MDSLIRSLEVFGVTQNKQRFDDSIDNIFNNLSIKPEEPKIEDPDKEWETLKTNYSKLRYVYQLLNHYNYTLSDRFFVLLRAFTDSLDGMTQCYIEVIEYEKCDDEELKQSYDEIKDHLGKSLNTHDQVDKIKYTLKAYDILVPIIEDFRRESWDDSFYSPPTKRLKK